MKIIPKFQAGGEMPADAQEAPMDQGQQQSQDPVMMIAQAAQQALQNQDCQMAMQVCQAFLQLVQQMAQQSGQAGGEEEAPVYAKKGGKLVRKMKR